MRTKSTKLVAYKLASSGKWYHLTHFRKISFRVFLNLLVEETKKDLEEIFSPLSLYILA